MVFEEVTLIKLAYCPNSPNRSCLPQRRLEIAGNHIKAGRKRIKESHHSNPMCPIDDIFKYAVKTDVNGTLYYDFNAHSYHRLKTLSNSDPNLQRAINENVEESRHYGQCYLVPVEAVNNARKHKND